MPTAVEAATHPTDGYGAGLLHPVPFFFCAQTASMTPVLRPNDVATANFPVRRRPERS